MAVQKEGVRVIKRYAKHDELDMTDRTILEKLAEAEKEASGPDAIWLSHDEVFSKIREK